MVRQKHLDLLFAQYQEKIAAGETVNCFVSSFGDDKLSMEVSSFNRYFLLTAIAKSKL